MQGRRYSWVCDGTDVNKPPAGHIKAYQRQLQPQYLVTTESVTILYIHCVTLLFQGDRITLCSVTWKPEFLIPITTKANEMWIIQADSNLGRQHANTLKLPTLLSPSRILSWPVVRSRQSFWSSGLSLRSGGQPHSETCDVSCRHPLHSSHHSTDIWAQVLTEMLSLRKCLPPSTSYTPPRASGLGKFHWKQANYDCRYMLS